MNIETKKKIVEGLRAKFEKASLVVLADYKGLNVSDVSKLREKLKESSSEYKVAKNTLFAKASDDTDAALIREDFKGSSAITLSYEDPVAPVKILIDFAKNNKQFAIKKGVLNGQVLDFEALVKLSKLPPREELIAKLLGVFNAVPTSFVRVLAAVPSGFLNVLQAVKDQKNNSN